MLYMVPLQVPVDPYIAACEYDSCGCNRGGDCECLCAAIAAYVRMCNRAGVHIKWRSQFNCRKEFSGHLIRLRPLKYIPV